MDERRHNVDSDGPRPVISGEGQEILLFPPDISFWQEAREQAIRRSRVVQLAPEESAIRPALVTEFHSVREMSNVRPRRKRGKTQNGKTKQPKG